MNEDSYKKQKRFKEILKKVVINIFVWLVIISFVISLGMYIGSGRTPEKPINVFDFNGKPYQYYPSSLFSYIIDSEKAKVDYTKVITKEQREYINSYVVASALENAIIYEMLYDLSRKSGLKPSKEILKSMVYQYTGGGYNYTPAKGIIDFLTREYINISLNGNYGDIANSISSVSIAEAVSYADILNFEAIIEFVYLDITNYILSKVSDKDLEEFYKKAPYKYSSKVFVDLMKIKSKKGAEEILNYALKNGWDKALANYSSRIVYEQNRLLEDKLGETKRFSEASKYMPDSIVTNAIFEQSEYNIIKVVRYPDYKDVSNYHELVKNDYVKENWQRLIVANKEEFNNLYSKMKTLVEAGNSISNIAKEFKLNIIKTEKFTPINLYLLSDKKETLNYPILDSEEIMDFIFRQKKSNKVKVFKESDYIIAVNLINRNSVREMASLKFDINMYKTVQTFKNIATVRDFKTSLTNRYKYKVYEENLKKIRDSI